MSDEPESIIEDIQEEARAKGETDARWEALNRRLDALESRPQSEPVDFSPVEAALAGFSTRLDEFGSRLTAREAAASHEMEVSAASKDVAPEPEPEESQDIAPQIDIAAATRSAVKPERAPKPSHFLFRRLGRG